MNEVGRCAQTALALGVVQMLAPGRPLSIVDVGTGSGLGLHLDRYHVDLGPAGSVPADCAGLLTCTVRGRPPLPAGAPEIVQRVGIDADPVDLDDPAARAWLAACLPPTPDGGTRLARRGRGHAPGGFADRRRRRPHGAPRRARRARSRAGRRRDRQLHGGVLRRRGSVPDGRGDRRLRPRRGGSRSTRSCRSVPGRARRPGPARRSGARRRQPSRRRVRAAVAVRGRRRPPGGRGARHRAPVRRAGCGGSPDSGLTTLGRDAPDRRPRRRPDRPAARRVRRRRPDRRPSTTATQGRAIATFKVGDETFKVELGTPELVEHAKQLLAGEDVAAIPLGSVVAATPARTPRGRGTSIRRRSSSPT